MYIDQRSSNESVISNHTYNAHEQFDNHVYIYCADRKKCALLKTICLKTNKPA